METMLRRIARMLSWHSLLVHQPLEVSTSSRHTEARVALHIERYNIYSIYTIYTIYILQYMSCLPENQHLG